jgi:class 3 adenylate cyclase
MAALSYHLEWFVGAPAQRIWPFLSDTDRLNRTIGLPSVDWREEAMPDGGARRVGSFKVKGVYLEWEEHPWEWRESQAFSILRTYLKGPLKRQAISVKLQRVGALDRTDGGTEEGTKVVWDLELEPSHALLVPLLRFIASDMVKSLEALHKRLDEQLKGFPVVIFPPETVELTAAAVARTATIAQQLQKQGFSAIAVDRLIDHVKTASALDCQKMRPFALADQWDEPRVTMLKLFLHATRVGLLDLSWDMICPHCRGSSESGDNLGDLAENAHCTSCKVDFEADFSRSVELTFHPNAAVRHVDVQVFCIGGPQNTPHVVAQSLLPAGGAARWELSLAPGAYRFRSPDAQVMGAFEVTKGAGRGPDVTTVVLGPDGFAEESLSAVGPDVRLEIKNSTGKKHLVLLERTAWADHVVTADFISTMHEFRTLFSEQVLAPGVKVKVAVARLAFLFSDLKSSTAMYEEQGDAKAFALVRDHFKVLEDPIAAEGGSVVKTIGDAIMAVFPDAASCFRAGLAIQSGITAYNAKSGDIPLIVKLGGHVGACLAVNLNDKLDYFGTTVNVAARVQGESVGEDFVLTEAMTQDPGVAEVLAQGAYEADVYDMQLKGLTDTFKLTRLWPLQQRLGALLARE